MSHHETENTMRYCECKVYGGYYHFPVVAETEDTVTVTTSLVDGTEHVLRRDPKRILDNCVISTYERKPNVSRLSGDGWDASSISD